MTATSTGRNHLTLRLQRMNWFRNDWILIGIAVLIAAIGFPLGYFGIVAGEIALVSLMPLVLAVMVVLIAASVRALKGSIDLTNHLTKNWPDWARDLVGISHWRTRPHHPRNRGRDDAQN